MGLFDGFATAKKDEPETSVTKSSVPGENASELLRDFAPSSVAGSRSIGQEKLYNPYEGISDALGGRKVVFRLPEGPEFVFEEEAAKKRRGWGDNMQFYTGMGYLGGGSTGIAVGAAVALQQRPEIGMDTMKLRANRLLNSAGSMGRRFGNGMGVLAFYFAGLEGLANYYIGPQLPDSMNTALAGFGAAALFRSPRGVRQALAAGVVGAVGAGCLAAARNWYPDL